MKPLEVFLDAMNAKAKEYISQKYGVPRRNIEITKTVGGEWNIYITADHPEVRCDFESDTDGY